MSKQVITPRINKTEIPSILGQYEKGGSVIPTLGQVPITILDLSKMIPRVRNHSAMAAHKFKALKDDVKRHSEEPYIDFPVLVRPIKHGMYEIIDGHHRFQVVKELGWSKVSVRVLNVSESMALKISVRRNAQHGEFTDVLAEEIQGLLDAGESIEDLAGSIAMNEREIMDLAASATLPEELLKSSKRMNGKKGSGELVEDTRIFQVSFHITEKERSIINAAIDNVLDADEESAPGSALAAVCSRYLAKFQSATKPEKKKKH